MKRSALQRPEKVGRIELTDRDKALIRLAYTLRFFTTDHAEQLTNSTSRRKLNSRLQQLWAHGYLERPLVQREAYGYAKKRHVVHALGQQGAAWLSKNDGVRFPKGKGWRTANQLKSSERLAHGVGVSDTMLNFRSSVTSTPDLRLIFGPELLTTADWPTGLKPHRLPTEIITRDGKRVPRGTDPDYTFALGLQRDGHEQRALFFLEWDNASEDYEKTNPKESAILQKHLAYADAHHRRLHRDLYGIQNFRVLFVVNGDKASDRVMKMRHVYERRVSDKAPAGIFLYATMDDLVARGALSDIWHTPAGATTTLV